MEIGRDDAILISDDGVIVISDEESERTIEDTIRFDTTVDVIKQMETGLDDIGSRDKDLLSKLEKLRRWKMAGLRNALLSGGKVGIYRVPKSSDPVIKISMYIT